MNKDDGLYVRVIDNGLIERSVISDGERTQLTTVSIVDEIIYFSETNFYQYARVVNQINDLSETVYIDTGNVFADVDMRAFLDVLNKTYEFAHTLKQHDPLLGTLTNTLLDNYIPKDDGTASYVINALNEIDICLKDTLEIHLKINEILYDISNGYTLDYENKFKIFSHATFHQICDIDEKITVQYVFRSLSDYYRFLVMRILESKTNIARCEFCGRYFVPKTKKITLYCDRVIRNGKTCKEVAPAYKHRHRAEGDEVIGAFDHVKQKMYKRYERARDSDKSADKGAGQYEKFYLWEEKAREARDGYLSGKVGKEDALRVIEGE